MSVIIPTHKRPHFIGRAIASVLAQTLTPIEVIVVVDGHDDATLESLSKFDDPRIRIRVLPIALGTGSALNAGVDWAKSRWVAILNDDDEWFAEKLERQMAVAAASQFDFPVVATRVIGRSERGDLCWPRRFPEPSEPISEYIFCQRGFVAGEGLILPSATLTSRELLNRVPFREGLRRHTDVDWLLRVAQVAGVGVEFVPWMAPLVIWNIDENHLRMSHSTDWRFSLDWVRARRDLMTRRAYGAFVLTRVGSTAARARDFRAFFVLLKDAFRLGQPNTAELIAYFIIWFLPMDLRRRITLFFEKMKQHTVIRQPGP